MPFCKSHFRAFCRAWRSWWATKPGGGLGDIGAGLFSPAVSLKAELGGLCMLIGVWGVECGVCVGEHEHPCPT